MADSSSLSGTRYTVSPAKDKSLGRHAVDVHILDVASDRHLPTESFSCCTGGELVRRLEAQSRLLIGADIPKLHAIGIPLVNFLHAPGVAPDLEMCGRYASPKDLRVR